MWSARGKKMANRRKILRRFATMSRKFYFRQLMKILKSLFRGSISTTIADGYSDAQYYDRLGCAMNASRKRQEMTVYLSDVIFDYDWLIATQSLNVFIKQRAGDTKMSEEDEDTVERQLSSRLNEFLRLITKLSASPADLCLMFCSLKC